MSGCHQFNRGFQRKRALRFLGGPLDNLKGLRAPRVKGGVKLDHRGGAILDQMSVWGMGLGSECGVWSRGLRSGLRTGFRPERKTPHSARDVVVI
jgi:hypothetical protein